MSLPIQKKEYTIEDIYALPDGVRAELIDGKIYTWNHQAGTSGNKECRFCANMPIIKKKSIWTLLLPITFSDIEYTRVN